MKECYFCRNGIKKIHWRNPELLARFTSVQGKIKPPKKTGVCSKHQRQLARAIKKARIMALLPFVK